MKANRWKSDKSAVGMNQTFSTEKQEQSILWLQQRLQQLHPAKVKRFITNVYSFAKISRECFLQPKPCSIVPGDLQFMPITQKSRSLAVLAYDSPGDWQFRPISNIVRKSRSLAVLAYA
jgi:hypothetical protein